MSEKAPNPSMLKMRIGASFCSAILLQASATLAAEYYVSANGADSNPGSLSLPWKTIKKATSLLAAGDTAYIRAGTYNEDTITFANSGAADRRITLKAYPGETPIIDGGYTAPIGSRKALFWFNFGKSHITLDGLTMMRGISAGVYIGEDPPLSSSITIQNCEIKDIVVDGNTAAVILTSNASAAAIRGNKLHPETQNTSRGSGIELFTGANNHLVENNEIYHAVKGIYYKHGAIQGSGNENNSMIVRNNVIHDINSSAGGEVTGIESSTDRMQILNNLLRDIGGAGIRVYEVAATCDRVGAFYTRISHNSIINTLGPGIALFAPSPTECTDRGAKYSTVTDNVVYKTVSNSIGGFAIWHYGSAAIGLHNTTSDYNLNYAVDTANVWRLYGNLYSSVGAWNAATAQDAGANLHALDVHSLQAAPVFVDAAAHDYSLAAGSPGKNAASDGADMGADMRAVGLNRALDALPPSAPIKLRTE